MSMNVIRRERTQHNRGLSAWKPARLFFSSSVPMRPPHLPTGTCTVHTWILRRCASSSKHPSHSISEMLKARARLASLQLARKHWMAGQAFRMTSPPSKSST